MFTLTLVTPEKRVITGQEISEIVVPAFMGELDILPGHAPMVTTLVPGILKYKLKNAQGGSDVVELVSVSRGYVEVSPHGVSILAETIESKEEVDANRAKAALEREQKRLMEETMSDDEHREAQFGILRARARIELSEH